MKDKINEFIKKAISNEETLKRIALYLFIICILLGLIFFKLNDINKNIEESPLLNYIEQKELESVSDVFIEREDDKHMSDYLPIFGEEESSTKIDNSETNQTVTNSNDKKDTVDDTSTSNNINPSKFDFVINVNSNKIHYADCSFVNRMKEDNRKFIQLSNAELKEYINNGYTLCSSCGG